MSTRPQALTDEQSGLLQQIDPSLVENSSPDPMQHSDLRVQPVQKATTEFLSNKPEPPSALVKGLSATGAAFEGAVKGGVEMGKTVLAPEGNTEAEKLKYIGKKLIAEPTERMRQKAQSAQTDSETLGYLGAGAIPIVGPFVADVAEQVGTQLGSGEYAQAAGTVLGNVAGGELLEKAGEVTKEGVEPVVKAAGETAKTAARSAGEEIGSAARAKAPVGSKEAGKLSLDPMQHHDIRVEPATKTVTVKPQAFIDMVSSPESKVSQKIVDQYRSKIRGGQDIEPGKIEVDSEGNLINADGRHRALAHLQEGKDMQVEITKRAPEEEEDRLDLDAQQQAAVSRGRSPYTDFHDLNKRVDNPILRNSVTNNMLNQGQYGETFDSVAKLTTDMTKKSAAKEGGDFGFESVKGKVDTALKNLNDPKFEENIAKQHEDYKNSPDHGNDYVDAAARADYAKRGFNFGQNNIRPFNEVQQLAHDSATAVAAGNFSEAKVKLGMMKDILDKGKDAWVAEASKTSKYNLPEQGPNELPVPAKYAKIFAPENSETPYTWQNVRIHEAGHAIVGKAMGFEVGDMSSHLDTKATKDALASQSVDMSKGTNPIEGRDVGGKSKLTVSAMKPRIMDALNVFFGGPIAQEIHGGVPFEKNVGKAGDVSAAHKFLSAIGVPRAAHYQYFDKAMANVRDILTHDSARDILEKYTKDRNPDLPRTQHMDAATVNKMADEFLEGKYGKDWYNKPSAGATEGAPAGDNEVASGVGGNAVAGREGADAGSAAGAGEKVSKTWSQAEGSKTWSQAQGKFIPRDEWLKEQGTLEQPESNIKLSPEGSSVPLYGAPLEVKAKVKGGTPMVTDVATALSDLTKAELGSLKLGQATPEEMIERGAKAGEDEARYQLATNNSGAAWYTDQMKEHDATAIAQRPSLKAPEKLSLFHFAEAILSSGQKPYGNYKSTIKAWDAYMDTGKFSRKNPATGKSWGPRGEAAYGNAFDMMNRLIKEKGEKGASEWLLADHSIKELKEYNKGVDVEKGRATAPGAYILGPKRGAFGLNLHGIETEFTADMWVSRTWNRWMGTVETALDKNGETELRTDSPRNPTERALMRQSFDKIAEKFGKTTSSMQAILWYYEQGLYRAHGLNTESWSFSGAAKRAAQEEAATSALAMKPGVK